MECKKYRIGNDIPVTWRVLTNGERTSLAGRNISVLCHDAYRQSVPVEWTVNGCEVSATIRGKNQKNLGKLILELVENKDEDNMATLDVMVVELVAHSWQAKGDVDGVKLATASFETSLSVTEIQTFRQIAADIPGAMEAATAANEAATAANEAAVEQLQKGMQRHNEDWWNMNTLLVPGFYEGCWRGRPAGSSDDEFYSCQVVVAKRAEQNDGVMVIVQIAFSSLNAQRVFIRKLLTSNPTVFEPPTTVYEDWKLVGADALTALANSVYKKTETYRKTEIDGKLGLKEDVIQRCDLPITDLAEGTYAADSYEAGLLIQFRNNSSTGFFIVDNSCGCVLTQGSTFEFVVFAADKNIHIVGDASNEYTVTWKRHLTTAEKNKVDATTLAGKGITDAYTKTEVNSLISGNGGVFIAEYGTTSYQDIYEAMAYGKIVLCENGEGSDVLMANRRANNKVYFYAINAEDNAAYAYSVSSEDEWEILYEDNSLITFGKVETSLSDKSALPVQNKVITAALSGKQDAIQSLNGSIVGITEGTFTSTDYEYGIIESVRDVAVQGFALLGNTVGCVLQAGSSFELVFFLKDKIVQVINDDLNYNVVYHHGLTTNEKAKVDATTLAGKGITDAYTKTEVDSALAEKQGVLTPGTNITIDENNVISASGGQITVDSELDSTSENPVQNKAIYAVIGDLETILASI